MDDFNETIIVFMFKTKLRIPTLFDVTNTLNQWQIAMEPLKLQLRLLAKRGIEYIINYLLENHLTKIAH